MTDTRIPPHIDQNLDFSRYGGRARVQASLDANEEIQYAADGWLEEASTAPGGGGKKQEGLLLITDRRVLVIRRPGAFRKNPSPISIPFGTIYNAGSHKSVPNAVVVLSDTNYQMSGHYLVLPSDEPEMTAIIWGTTILEYAEAAGGTSKGR